MGIVNASIPFTGKMNGFVFRHVGEKDIVQTMPKEIKNRQSYAQQKNRVRILNGMAFVMAMHADGAKFGFEERRGSVSDQAIMLRYGSRMLPEVYITGSHKEDMMTVLTEFPVSRGSLPSIGQHYDATLGELVTDIMVSDDGHIDTQHESLVLLKVKNYSGPMGLHKPECLNAELNKDLMLQATVEEINAEAEQYGMGLRVVDGHLALDMATDEAACIYAKQLNRNESDDRHQYFYYSSQDLTITPELAALRSKWTTTEALDRAIQSSLNKENSKLANHTCE